VKFKGVLEGSIRVIYSLIVVNESESRVIYDVL